MREAVQAIPTVPGYRRSVQLPNSSQRSSVNVGMRTQSKDLTSNLWEDASSSCRRACTYYINVPDKTRNKQNKINNKQKAQIKTNKQTNKEGHVPHNQQYHYSASFILNSNITYMHYRSTYSLIFIRMGTKSNILLHSDFNLQQYSDSESDKLNVYSSNNDHFQTLCFCFFVFSYLLILISFF